MSRNRCSSKTPEGRKGELEGDLGHAKLRCFCSRVFCHVLSRFPPKPLSSLPRLVIYGVTSRELCLLDCPLQRGSTTAPGSKIPQKASWNSNKATMLTVTVYYRERIQTEISKEQRHSGWSWRESRHRLLVGLSQWCCVDRAASAQQGSVTTHKESGQQPGKPMVPWCWGLSWGSIL